MRIRIVGIPPGEAPAEVRQAWVGLEVPLGLFETGPRKVFACGVLSGPRSLSAFLWRFVTGRLSRVRCYMVPVDEALAGLDLKAPQAAAWWRANAPHLIGRGRSFGFDASVCEPVE